MKLQLEINISSSTLGAALFELQRQYDKMQRAYPEWQKAGQISGQEAEKRLFAQEVAIRAVAALAKQAKQEELNIERFGEQE